MKKGIFGFGRGKKEDRRPAPAQPQRGALPPAPPQRRLPDKSFAYLVERKRQEREMRETPAGYSGPWLETGSLYSGSPNILLNFESQINALKDAMKMLGEKMTTVYREMEKLRVVGAENDMTMRRIRFNIDSIKPDVERDIGSTKSEISRAQAKISSVELGIKEMRSTILELKGVLEKVKSIENLIKVSHQIKSDLEKMEGSKEHILKTAGKLDRKFRELRALRKKADSAEDTIRDVLTVVADLDVKAAESIKKDQLEKFRSELNKTLESSKKQMDTTAGKLGAKVKEFDSLRKKVETNEEIVSDLLKSVEILDSKGREITHTADSVNIIRKRVAENVIRLKEVEELRKRIEKDREVLDGALKFVSRLEVKTNEMVKFNAFRNMKTSLTERVDELKKELDTLAGKADAKIREFESLRKKVETNKEITMDLMSSMDSLDTQTRLFVTKEDMGKVRESIESARNDYEDKVQHLKERLDKVIAIKGDTLIRIGKKEFATKAEFDRYLRTLDDVRKRLEEKIRAEESSRKEEMNEIRGIERELKANEKLISGLSGSLNELSASKEEIDRLARKVDGLDTKMAGLAKDDVGGLAEQIKDIRGELRVVTEDTDRRIKDILDIHAAGQKEVRDIERMIKTNEKSISVFSDSLKKLVAEKAMFATKEEMEENARTLDGVEKRMEGDMLRTESAWKEEVAKIRESIGGLAKTASGLDAEMKRRVEGVRVHVDNRLKTKDTEIASLSKRIGANRERAGELARRIGGLDEKTARMAKSEDVRVLEREVREIKSNSRRSFRAIKDKLMKAVNAKGEFFIRMGRKNFVTKEELGLRARKQELSALEENIRKGFATKGELREESGKMVGAEHLMTDIRKIRAAEKGLREEVMSMKETFTTKEELEEHEKNMKAVEDGLNEKLEEVRGRIKVIDDIEKGLEESAKALREEKEVVPFKVSLKKVLGK